MILPEALLALAVGWSLGIGICRAAAWLIASRTSGGEHLDESAEVVVKRPGHCLAVPALCKVAPRRLLIQAATALATAALWLRYGPDLALALPLAVAWLLVLIAAVDLERRLVLNELLVVGVVLALLRIVSSAFGDSAHGWFVFVTSVTGGLVALALFAVVAILGRGSLGAGDVKLAGLLGLLLGLPDVLRALAWGILLGGVVAAALLAARKVHRRTMIPYAPFLAAGGILALLLN